MSQVITSSTYLSSVTIVLPIQQLFIRPEGAEPPPRFRTVSTYPTEEDAESGMQRSYDCPECGEAAFVVVKGLDIVQCLHCGSYWELKLPPPGADEEVAIPGTKEAP